MAEGDKKHKRKPRFADLILGALPVEAINRTLGLELEPGDVVFTGGAQAHAYKRHPEDFARCLGYVGMVVTAPTYVGDDFVNGGKIELVSRVAALGEGLLVAIIVEPDEAGKYRVASAYPLPEGVIDARRQKQHLKITQTK